MAPSPGFLLWGLWWLGTNDAATWEGECSDSIGLIPDSLGRRDRRRLTKLLNAQVSCLVTPLPVWDPLLGLRGGAVVIRWRRRRGHMCERQRTTWQRQPQLSFWMGWPLRGRRVGEASHPGPEPGTPIGSERPPRERSPPPRAPAHGGAGAARGGRTYCPVAGCPCSDPARARGWANESSMRAHIDAHLAGSLDGDVPTAWMQARGRIRCPVCGLSVSERYGVHPTCRPEARAAAVDDVDAMEVDGLPLPTLAAIQSARTSTLRHIPMAARHAWNQVLTRALAAVAHRNDVATWLELLMLPQCVLCAPGRGGRRHRKAAAAFTLDRLQRWQEGERLSLWESRPRRRPPRSGPLTPEERRDIATSWGREGFDRKACAALMSKGLCPQTEETARALAALHPHRPLPSTPAMGDLPVPPALAPELVARCLRAFPVETAPGPTGLRVQHLRDACVAGGGDSFMAQLADVVNLMAQGRAPVGVAVKGGAEKAVHAVRAWSARHSGSSHKALLKLDFRNAFNCVSREEVLKQTVVHFPALARWAAWCYRQPSCLQFGDRALESSAGVQQGDPLGPLLFSLALQPLAAELRSDSLDLAVHFLDDGVLAGDFAPLGAALRLAQTRSRAIGLELNLDKCELVVFGAPNTQLLRPHFPANLLQRPDGSSRVLVNNFEFLGAAIGEAAALATFDGHVQRCFGDLTGLHLTAGQWRQAARGVGQAGLGLRASLVHAPAAYLASLGASLADCADIDRAFSAQAVHGSPAVAAALRALNRELPQDSALSLCEALAAKQRALSERVDLAGWEAQLAQASLVERAVLRSEAGLGARAFLAATPSGRTRLERPGLLLPHLARRRPADIYVPSLAGSPAALDFAITAPQRQETLALAGQEAGAAAAAYARHKEDHQSTARTCEAQGVTFVPMVAETTGNWDAGAAVVIKHVARAVAARTGEMPSLLHSLLLQELCVAARSHRAKAALRRRLATTALGDT
ncbi:unnamed protein product [Symbiodinium natans]|uniref:Reverse transcriptase domain-containing protein n=1 Tax=Symbiodinium natans TaxID=878477 RepID=A0A812UKV5_9DINO|nr:unnamed protein product [Symbiodinium natans]